MTTHWSTIDSKHRRSVGNLAGLADFTTTPGDAVDPALVLDDPTLSLYCLDHETERAIFVQLPADVALTTVPFVYMTQYEQAERLLSMPYQAFLALAERLPDPETLIAIYMTGRSGSTLLSRLLGEVGGVLSLSEPDVITQFPELRRTTGDEALKPLLRACVRFLARPTPAARGSVLAMKFRAEGVQVMDLIAATYPEVRSLFSYRDAVGWVASFYRLCKRMGAPDSEPWEEAFAWHRIGYHENLLDPERYLGRRDEVPLMESLALYWLTTMDQYLKQHARGVRVLAVRYPDLDRQREAVVRAILEHCGLPASAAPDALRAFARDAQEGTVLERAKAGEEHLRLNREQVAQVEAVVRKHPVVSRPDYLAPATLDVQAGAGTASERPPTATG